LRGRSRGNRFGPGSPQVRHFMLDPSRSETYTCWTPEPSGMLESTRPSRVQLGAWPKAAGFVVTANEPVKNGFDAACAAAVPSRNTPGMGSGRFDIARRYSGRRDPVNGVHPAVMARSRAIHRAM